MNTLTIIQTDHPDHQQLTDLLQLAEHCRKYDHIALSAPVDPEDHAVHFLLYKCMNHSKILFASLSLICYDEETAECIAFTHPEHRRNGYFSRLLEQAEELLGNSCILFPVSGNCPDTLAVLEHLDAELDSQELQMELNLSDAAVVPTNDRFTLSCQNSESGLTEWLLLGEHPMKLLGSCQTSRISETSVCLHHVEILPQFRGLSYGTVLMEKLIHKLKSAGISRIILQVAGDNQTALALYKKQGFRITETLSFYLY